MSIKKTNLEIKAASFITYFKIFQAMRMKPWNGKEAMVGRTGLVIQDIDPEGKIQYDTEIWNAIADGKKFAKGDKVIIHGFSWGLRVLVQETPVKKYGRMH